MNDYKSLALEKIQSLKKEKVDPYQLNLFGIRNINKVNTFNDSIVYWYYDNDKKLNIWQCDKFTTDPGNKSLASPVSSKGCAILCENIYFDKLWVVGLHKNQYKALVQYSPCKVYRDNNKDLVLDFNPKTIDEGIFGINMHRANANTESIYVENWSAGCMVWANPLQFNSFLKIVDICVEKSKQKYFDWFISAL